MADNTPVNPAIPVSGGDTIRTVQRPASATNPVAGTKTEVVQLDFGGDGINAGTAETLVTVGTPLPTSDVTSLDLLNQILWTLVAIRLQMASAYQVDIPPSSINSDGTLN